MVTRLRINVSKSEMVQISDADNLDTLADMLGCKVGSLPMSYLGMPLGASYKSSFVWNPISPISHPLFGIQFWRNWEDGWQDGRKCIFLRGLPDPP